jgi:hypothetical protein
VPNDVRRFVIGIRDWSANFVPFASSAKDPIAETSHADQSFRVTLQPVPTKNSESEGKSKVLRFTAMTSPASAIPKDLLANQARSANLWWIEPTVASQNLVCAAVAVCRNQFTTPAQVMRGRLDLRRNSGRTKF